MTKPALHTRKRFVSILGFIKATVLRREEDP
jgi:hypothetical protein